MIETHYKDRTIVISCDVCPESFEAETTVFREALDEAKAEGWIIRQYKGEWMHFCGQECFNKAKEK